MDRRRLALLASMTAASVALEASPLKVPFPLAPFLVIDFGEIPVMVLALLYGMYESTISALVLSAVLVALGQFVPVGPLFKFLAVESAALGAWAGLRAGKGAAIAFSTALRGAVMVAANLVLVWAFMPGFLSLIPDVPFMGALELYALLVLAFNAVQNAISVGVAMAVLKRLEGALGLGKAKGL